jgi:large subunit ribosomal protein L4
VHVVADLTIGDVPSTRTALSLVAKALGGDKITTKTLVVLHRDEDLAWISLRNAAALHVITVDQLNAYDVLVNDDIVFTASALSTYVAGPTKGKAAKSVATESEAIESENDGEELR